MYALDATEIPKHATADEESDAAALFDELYSELRRLARREVHRHGSLAGLGATTLLHEAYLKISGRTGSTFIDHAKFMGYAARVMRGLVIDDVRRRHAQKRGGSKPTFSLDDLLQDAERRYAIDSMRGKSEFAITRDAQLLLVRRRSAANTATSCTSCSTGCRN